VETATGVATANGTLANGAVEIPFAWSVENAHTGIALRYQTAAVATLEPHAARVRTSAREQVALAYPPEGGVANMDVDVAS